MRPIDPTMNSLHRNFQILFWFSATSFYHGAALIIALYFALTRCLDYGLSVFAILLIGYVGTVATSKLPFTGKGTKEWFKRSVVTQAPLEYFSMRTLGEEALDAVKGERVLFGLHPHGV